MSFFEGKQELYNMICFVFLPLFSCLPFACCKPNYIWYACLVNAVLLIVVTGLFFPYFIQDFFIPDADSTTIYWVIFFIPIQIVVSLIVTAIMYFVKKWAEHKL